MNALIKIMEDYKMDLPPQQNTHKLNYTIFIVDDDPAICQALAWLFRTVQLNVETYSTAQAFLEHYDKCQKGCLIVDVRLPVMSGLELLSELNLRDYHLPSIVITGHGDIQMAIRAMKLGAIDFVLKPFNEQELLELIQKILTQSCGFNNSKKYNPLWKKLTQREQEILNMILEGMLNKEIARSLNIAVSTVEVHRSRIMSKMEAKNIVHLIRLNL